MNEEQKAPTAKFKFKVLRGPKKLTEFEFEIVDMKLSQMREVLLLEQWLNTNTNVRVHIEQEPS